jgi:hypothetical protein
MIKLFAPWLMAIVVLCAPLLGDGLALAQSVSPSGLPPGAAVSAADVTVADQGACPASPPSCNTLGITAAQLKTFVKAGLAFTDLSGSASAAQLPNPSATTLGGVKSLAAVSHQYLTSISITGGPAQAQPVSGDLSDTVARTTFVPTITFATPGDLTVSYATQIGAFAKVGPLTCFWVNLVFTPTYTTAASNFQMTLGSLSPIDGNAWGYPLTFIGPPTWPGSTDTQVAAFAGGSFFLLRGMKSGANPSNFTVTQLPSGVAETVIFSGCFF